MDVKQRLFTALVFFLQLKKNKIIKIIGNYYLIMLNNKYMKFTRNLKMYAGRVFLGMYM